MILETIMLFICGTLFLVSLINVLFSPVFEKQKGALTDKKISVLIPARNEEANIENVIRSVMNQSYKNIELIVYNDNSTDATESILRRLKKEFSFKTIRGKPLPKGWMGKQYACHQLAKKATGDYFCFIDADVTLEYGALSRASSIYKGGLLSVFPKQIKKTLGEWLVVPLMNWFLLSVLPLPAIRKFKSSSYVAANGQFIFISRITYGDIGGHAGVKNTIVEDMALAKKAKQEGFPVQTFISRSNVQCRMYRSFSESVNGFEKNFFTAASTQRLRFLGMLFITAIALFTPYIVSNNSIAELALLLLIINKINIALITQDWLEVVFMPLHHVLFIAVGVKSAFAKKKKWKGRTY